MADVISRQRRSEVMAAVHSKGNKTTELKLAAIFRKHGIKGWRRQLLMLGNPDFVFSSKRLVVFVDGCFWHGCPIHGEYPASNRAYWLRKLKRNKNRDRRVSRILRKKGWQVVRLWEHNLSKPDRVIARMKHVLGGRKQRRKAQQSRSFGV